ncbi:outer membrane protein OmpU [Paracoccus alcaliphilus]|uniref:Outer membrane protein OmpU n=1 Tax=Paracoccus alcaliphilus TaxID=34002 RepID=A0A1H8GRL7_9RHOB|nr:porin [Paracoccus alcaliphilus]WCR18785.1 porin [Paracoccus alcaliphilus]SEN46643.1 outer membrane protein OmpU [Paracoccus alcaliphilus]
MKKALFATTALVLSAGVAAADVTISGYGRTGVIYYEDGVQTGGFNNSQVISRLRMNIDAATSTDQGVDFGARFRLQWDQNNGSRGDGGTTNAGKLYVTSQGLTVEVGNVDTAMDTNGLIYATELGAFDRSVGGNALGGFFAYESSKYGNVNRVGVRALYEIDNLTVQASYVDPDQTGALEAFHKEEISFSVDYVWNDVLELSAAASLNAAGYDDHDVYFVGARYAITEQARIGLNYIDNGDVGSIPGIVGPNTVSDFGKTIALYGDYTLLDGLTNIEAYIANNDGDWTQKETDNAFGIGVNYDLGGARLGASLQRDYQERVTADMGVRFNF